MESSYLKMVSGSRLSNYLGLQMDEGAEYKYPGVQERGYAYIEIPVSCIMGADGEVSSKASRNQHVQLLSACTVNVKGHNRFEVHPNPALWQYGVVQGLYYLEAMEGMRVPSFYVSLRKDLDLDVAGLEYAVRIYMRQ